MAARLGGTLGLVNVLTCHDDPDAISPVPGIHRIPAPADNPIEGVDERGRRIGKERWWRPWHVCS